MKNRKFFFSIIVLFFVLLILSCTEYPDGVKSTLKQSGNNRKELVKVLEYYSRNPADSSKYRAACFLIENMKWHFGKRIDIDDSFWNLVLIEDSLIKSKNIDESYWKTDQAWRGFKYLSKKMLVEMAIRNSISSNSFKNDATWINSDFLIDLIESSFNAKNSPLNKHLTFEEFCEYILAYRFNDEPVFNIRDDLMQLSPPQFIDRDNVHNSVEIIAYYNKYVEQFYWDWNDVSVDLPDLGFYNLLFWNINNMNCENHVAIQGQLLRALGMPVVEVFTPKWNDTNSGHSWCGILSEDNKISIFNAIYDSPDQHLDHFSLNLASKFFINTFAPNMLSPYFLKAQRETLHPVFSSPCIKDVTTQLIETSTIEMFIDAANIENNIAYFSTFVNGAWGPISWGIIDHRKNSVSFEDLPIGVIGLAGIYDGQGFIPKGKLIETLSDNKYAYIEPEQNTSDFVLYRKFPVKPRLQFFTANLIGSKVEGANCADFTDSEVLATIQDTLKPYLQDLTFENNQKYRYYRLIASDFELNIAEMEFLTANSTISCGQPQPVPDYDYGKEKTYYRIKGECFADNSDPRAFDKNILTFTNAKWVAIDLGIPQTINRIRVAPRNANNGIDIGDKYELMYWDNGWVSIGNKIAEYNILFFENVPSNTLYWLRNLSKGREEMPFRYTNNVQDFLLYNKSEVY